MLTSVEMKVLINGMKVVEQEDEERQSIVQGILRKSTDLLRRVIVPVEGQGGSPCRMSAVIATDSRWKTFSGGSPSGHGMKQCNWWCAPCGGQYNWKAPNRVLVTQDSTDRRGAKVFEGVCDNLITALKLLANKQKDGDSPVKMVAQGFTREKSAQHDGRAQKVHPGRHP